MSLSNTRTNSLPWCGKTRSGQAANISAHNLEVCTQTCVSPTFFRHKEYSWPKYGMLLTDTFCLISEVFKMYATSSKDNIMYVSVFTITLVKHMFRLAFEECRKTLSVYFAPLAEMSTGECTVS